MLFNDYDGQPVIIRYEIWADTFADALYGYGRVLSSIDVVPKNKREHKKFDDIRIISVSIITNTQDYDTFLKGIIPANDPDSTRTVRRIFFIFSINEADFDVMINADYLDDPAFSEYVS